MQSDAIAADGDGNNDEGATVVDFALGMGPLLVLIRSGGVLGLGRCDEGQLGPLAASQLQGWWCGESGLVVGRAGCLLMLKRVANSSRYLVHGYYLIQPYILFADKKPYN